MLTKKEFTQSVAELFDLDIFKATRIVNALWQEMEIEEDSISETLAGELDFIITNDLKK